MNWVKKIIAFIIFFTVLIGGFFIFNHSKNNKQANTTVLPIDVSSISVLPVVESDVTTKPKLIDKIDEDTLADPAREEIIDQLFIVGMRGMSYTEKNDFGNLLKTTNVGGIILFDYDSQTKKYSKNIKSKSQINKLTSDLQKNAKTKLFIAIDEEGGSVNRLKKTYGFTPIPSAQILGTKSLSFITSEAQRLAKDLKSIGINVNFAPVVDVNINPSSPAIGKYGRSFSADAKVVTNSARAFIIGQHKEGIINSIKHYPGHGSSTTDSHLGFVDITNTYNDNEILPFVELTKSNDADMVMVAHVLNKKIDPVYPASLSSIFIKDKLRNELGFKGIVITDDLDMGAITKNYTFEQKIVLAINAGNDILILSNNIKTYDKNVVIKARKAIEKALQDGTIQWSQIMSSYNRIQALKVKYKVI